MSLRHAVVSLMVGAPVVACALAAGLDADYATIADGDAGVLHGDGDATVPRDGGGDGPRVELAEASSDAGPTCVPQTCAGLGANCGDSIPDGCGNVLSCGTCDAATTCGAAGPNKCGQGPCDASVCRSDQCGAISNGCGGQNHCTAVCVPPMECQGGTCGGCIQDGTLCKQDQKTWPAWLCDDKGLDRGGGCYLRQYWFNSKAYYCCPPPA